MAKPTVKPKVMAMQVIAPEAASSDDAGDGSED
jgi:hypothetical protein